MLARALSLSLQAPGTDSAHTLYIEANAHTRKKLAQQSVDDREKNLEQRREHHAQGRLLETLEERVQNNAHRHVKRNEMDTKNMEEYILSAMRTMF